jgi:hypothetical protein
VPKTSPDETFWTGIGGWSDIQLPDGTLIWTSPSGTRYPTYPGSRIFFPNWDVTPQNSTYRHQPRQRHRTRAR